MKALSHHISLLQSIRPDLEKVLHLLQQTMARTEAPLGLKFAGLASGKLLRPALVILTGRIFDAPPPPFHHLAAAVETLHTATLIHDDLVDGASLRRGYTTLHETCSTKAAVLAGDHLMAQAAAAVAQLETPRLTRIFAETLCTMCVGELQQMTTPRERQGSRGNYYQRIEAKTASLCAAAMEMAGILAKAAEPHVDALRRFGREFGLAFQIADDVLDFTGDEAQMGKPAGSDLRQGLVTLPVLCHLELTEGDDAVRTVLACKLDAEHAAAAVAAAVEAIRASGAITAALDEAWQHTRKGQEALHDLPDTPARQVLHELIEQAVQRASSCANPIVRL